MPMTVGELMMALELMDDSHFDDPVMNWNESRANWDLLNEIVVDEDRVLCRWKPLA